MQLNFYRLSHFLYFLNTLKDNRPGLSLISISLREVGSKRKNIMPLMFFNLANGTDKQSSMAPLLKANKGKFFPMLVHIAGQILHVKNSLLDLCHIDDDINI